MSEQPIVGVLALQGDVREHRAMLERAGARTLAVRRASELAEVDGIVIPGGESTTMYKLARTFELFEPLRDAVREGLPAFGTCAGMILMARRASDGADPVLPLLDVTIERNAYGRQLDSHEADVAIPSLGDEPVHGVFIRAPVVAEADEGVEVLARDDAGRPIAVRQGRVLATAFHPELTGDIRVHRYFVELVRRAVRETR